MDGQIENTETINRYALQKLEVTIADLTQLRAVFSSTPIDKVLPFTTRKILQGAINRLQGLDVILEIEQEKESEGSNGH
jgi:hypothetical protein